MSPDTAEMAIADVLPAPAQVGLTASSAALHAPAAPATAAPAAPAPAPGPPAPRAPAPAAPRRVVSWPVERLGTLDSAQRAALRDTWRALWMSRVLVWLAGVGAVATFGFGPVRNAFNPPGVTRGFGWLGDLLAAPAARWDAAWYLVIAHFGYVPQLGSFTSARDAFFPLYPLGLGLLADTGLPPVLAGVLLSVLALGVGLYWLHRLTTLELGARWGAGGADVGRLAVLATALAPMGFYFSAVYSESLYLALSVGVFWFARQGRWVWVGVLGALAAATRSTGVLLLLPALMLYLYGPREDRSAERPAPDSSARERSARERARARPAARVRARLRALALRARPRYRMRREALWLGLIPLGLGVYLAYLGFAGGDPMSPFRAQQVWGRHFAGPYLGVWDGIKAAIAGAQQLLSAQRGHVYYPIAGGSPFIVAGHNVMLLVFLALALPLLVGAFRWLPSAYGVYTIAALALPLSYPVAPQPLMSLPRFLLVLFPLTMVLAGWLATHRSARLPVLVCSALAMMAFGAQFATWHWVA